MFILSVVALMFHFFSTEGASYLYIDDSGTIAEAGILCQRFGLDVARASTEEDIQDLNNIFAQVSVAAYAWLGLHYRSGNFYWLQDGSLLNHSCWNDLEPDYVDTDRCVVVNGADNMLWNTRNCRNNYPVMCGPYISEQHRDRRAHFSKWADGKEFSTEPTSSFSNCTLSKCANACMMISNCMFISMHGEHCHVYANMTTVTVRSRANTRIWNRDTISGRP